MKLRLLNGSHSTLAYLGFLAGPRVHLAGVARSAARDADRAADGRGDRCRRSRAPPGVDLARVLRAARRRASAIPRCRTARSRSRWTARRSCRSGCSARCASGSPAARRSRISRSRSPAGSATRAAPTSEGKPIAVSDPLAATFAAIAAAARGDAGADRRRLSRSRRSVRRRPRRAMRRFARAVSARRRRAVPRRRAPRRSPCTSRNVARRTNHGRIAARSSIPTGCSRPIRRRATSRARSTRRSRTCRS